MATLDMSKTRRVRPSSIQLLPSSADAAVAAALDAVIARGSATQRDALASLNNALAELGLGEITTNAFNRLVVRFRVEGIPARYRVANENGQADTADALVTLIDRRIDAALRRAGVAS